MNGNLVDVFTTKEYKLLCFLKGKQVTTADGNRILHSQEDISKEFGASIVTVNTLMKTLILTGCLEKCKKKSGYQVTAKGEYVIQQIASIDTDICLRGCKR